MYSFKIQVGNNVTTLISLASVLEFGEKCKPSTNSFLNISDFKTWFVNFILVPKINIYIFNDNNKTLKMMKTSLNYRLYFSIRTNSLNMN